MPSPPQIADDRGPRGTEPPRSEGQVPHASVSPVSTSNFGAWLQPDGRAVDYQEDNERSSKLRSVSNSDTDSFTNFVQRRFKPFLLVSVL